ncbi:MAG TPA: MFS transporter [Patescibacteria group bacterium]|nr:MFS transporter [Patescibacteria group bacterium]
MANRLSLVHITWDNITKATLINFFSALYFYLPIATLWYQNHGLSLTQIESLNGIGTITLVLTTVFTGMFADKYGRKSAIVMALILQLLGEAIFLFSNSFPMFILCAIAAGLGFSFWSGAFDALIIDSLKENNRQNETQKTMGSIMAYKGLSTILGAGVSSFIVAQLVTSRFILAILLTIGSVGIALLISLFIKEPQRLEITHKLSPKELLSKSISLLKQNRKLSRLVVLAIFTTPFTAYLISLYQPYFLNLHIQGQWFGLAYAIGGSFVLLSSKYAYFIEKKLGGKTALLIFTLLPGIFFGLMAITSSPWLAITFFCLNYGSAAFQNPLFIDYTNRHIPSETRATLLSFIAMLSSFYVAVMGPVIGALADRSIPIAFILMGICIIAGALFFRIDESHLVDSSIE